jgi:hypothetical protein
MFVDPSGLAVRVYTETKSTGHAWLSTGEGENMTVFSFGRYADLYAEFCMPNMASNGQGILLKLTGENARGYNQEKTTDTKVSIFEIQDADESKVFDYMNAIYNASNKPAPTGKRPDGRQYYHYNSSGRVVNDWKLLSNTCAVITSKAINASGSKSLEVDIPYLYYSHEGFRTGHSIYNETYLMPSYLEAALLRKSKEAPARVKQLK